MRYLSLPLVIFVVYLLVGCTPNVVRPDRMPPVNLISECEKLPNVDGKTLRDLVENHVEVASLYQVCAARHKALSDWALNK